MAVGKDLSETDQFQNKMVLKKKKKGTQVQILAQKIGATTKAYFNKVDDSIYIWLFNSVLTTEENMYLIYKNNKMDLN